jgi:hypothetical protein
MDSVERLIIVTKKIGVILLSQRLFLVWGGGHIFNLRPFKGQGFKGKKIAGAASPATPAIRETASHPQLWIRESVLSPYQKRHIVHSIVSEGKSRFVTRVARKMQMTRDP